MTENEAVPKFSVGLSEVALGVANVATSLRFYQEIVGLVPEVVDEKFALLWAGRPGQQQRVILLSRSLEPISERQGSGSAARGPENATSEIASIGPADFGRTHFALDVPRDRLESAVAHVRDQGVEVFGPVEFDWLSAVTFYFLDPDGNLVEFWSPSPRKLEGPPAVATGIRRSMD